MTRFLNILIAKILFVMDSCLIIIIKLTVMLYKAMYMFTHIS